MRSDETFRVSATTAIRGNGTPRNDHLHHSQQKFRDLQVALVAGAVKCNQNFVRQAPRVATRLARSCFTTDAFAALAHPAEPAPRRFTTSLQSKNEESRRTGAALAIYCRNGGSERLHDERRENHRDSADDRAALGDPNHRAIRRRL